MKRLALSTLALLLATLVLAASGATAPTQTVDWKLAGTAVWSGPGVLAETFAIHGAVQGVGSYSGTLHAGTYFTTDTCGPQCAPVTGTIDFVTNRGTLTTTVDPQGLVTVTSIGSGTTYYFSLPLTIANGTRSYGHASGGLTLTYASHLPTNQIGCNVCPIEDSGTLAGQVARTPFAN
jgi:hypothetical protein